LLRMRRISLTAFKNRGLMKKRHSISSDSNFELSKRVSEILQLKPDIEAAEKLLERHEANGSKTISHEEMMKKVGWDKL
jgi:hypothetical protein